MRKATLILVAFTLALGATACGSSTHRTEAKTTEKAVAGAVKKDPSTAKAKAIANACIKKGGGWRAEVRCAIPKGHGRQFASCVFKHKPKNLHDQAADAKDLEDCGVRYR